MKIQDAKKAYAAQMDTLWTRKRDLSQALKNCQQGGAPNVDRVEISRELSAMDAQYNALYCASMADSSREISTRSTLGAPPCWQFLSACDRSRFRVHSVSICAAYAFFAS